MFLSLNVCVSRSQECAGDRRAPKSVPAVVKGLSGRFPMASLRLLYVQARIAMFRVTDWLK